MYHFDTIDPDPKVNTGVYGIIHTESLKIYIGSVTRKVGFNGRFTQHRSELRKGIHHSRHLQRAWNKYGETAFQFVVIVRCLPEYCIEVEQCLMDWFKSYNVHSGYNISKTAGNCAGVRHSADTIAKMSASLKGKKKSQHMRDALSKSLKGRKLSDQWKKNLSLAALRRHRKMPHIHTEELALSVEDLEENDHTTLCQGRLDLDHPFVAEVFGRKDTNGKMCAYKVYAVRFSCDLLIAASICDVIRSRDRNGKHTTTRVYLFRSGSWQKMPAGTVFTETVDGSVRLVRRIFPASSGPVVYNAPSVERPRPFSFED